MRALWVIVGIGVALRLALLPWSRGLEQRMEVSTLMASPRMLREGAFMLAAGADPYEHDFIAIHPVLVAALGHLNTGVLSLALVALDLCVGVALWDAARALAADHGDRDAAVVRQLSPAAPEIVLAAWLLNPLAVLSCAGQSLAVVPIAATAIALWAGARGRPLVAGVGVGSAAAVTIAPLLLAVPTALLLRTHLRAAMALALVTALAVWTAAGYAVAGHWAFASSVYGSVLGVRSLRPSIGVYWYLFTVMFEQYSPFYAFVAQAYPLLFVVPLSLRLAHTPTVLFAVLLGIATVFRIYFQVADLALLWALGALVAPALPSTWRALSGIAVFVVLVCVIAPVFLHMWLDSEAGNANFFFNATLGLLVAHIAAMITVVNAATRADK